MEVACNLHNKIWQLLLQLPPTGFACLILRGLIASSEMPPPLDPKMPLSGIFSGGNAPYAGSWPTATTYGVAIG